MSYGVPELIDPKVLEMYLGLPPNKIKVSLKRSAAMFLLSAIIFCSIWEYGPGLEDGLFKFLLLILFFISAFTMMAGFAGMICSFEN